VADLDTTPSDPGEVGEVGDSFCDVGDTGTALRVDSMLLQASRKHGGFSATHIHAKERGQVETDNRWPAGGFATYWSACWRLLERRRPTAPSLCDLELLMARTKDRLLSPRFRNPLCTYALSAVSTLLLITSYVHSYPLPLLLSRLPHSSTLALGASSTAEALSPSRPLADPDPLHLPLSSPSRCHHHFLLQGRADTLPVSRAHLKEKCDSELIASHSRLLPETISRARSRAQVRRAMLRSVDCRTREVHM
jgi:hypothetical protein